jgi:tripeptidyl-peptidase-1
MKLSLQGHTILMATGDYGVGGPPGVYSASGCLSANGQNGTIFVAQYPVGCPWVTAVGGSMVEPDKTVLDPESAFQVTSPVSGNTYSSTGGFSNYFTTPSYQKADVEQYLRLHNPGYPSYVANADASNIGENGGLYNRAGRAIPDVAANAVNMALYVGGEFMTFYGCSLAAPIWASVVTLINQQRTIAGKGPVGFINPTLYANPWALNDITNGSNPNCGTSGFTAVQGWDPVTGLGTPVSFGRRFRESFRTLTVSQNYPKLLELFLSLP